MKIWAGVQAFMPAGAQAQMGDFPTGEEAAAAASPEEDPIIPLDPQITDPSAASGEASPAASAVAEASDNTIPDIIAIFLLCVAIFLEFHSRRGPSKPSILVARHQQFIRPQLVRQQKLAFFIISSGSTNAVRVPSLMQYWGNRMRRHPSISDFYFLSIDIPQLAHLPSIRVPKSWERLYSRLKYYEPRSVGVQLCIKDAYALEYCAKNTSAD
jgi:hypothetical protein